MLLVPSHARGGSNEDSGARPGRPAPFGVRARARRGCVRARERPALRLLRVRRGLPRAPVPEQVLLPVVHLLGGGLEPHGRGRVLPGHAALPLMVYVALAARALLAVVLAAACAGKLRSRDAFAELAAALAGVVPGGSHGSRSVAAAILACEAAAALLLVATPRAGLGAALVVLAL